MAMNTKEASFKEMDIFDIQMTDQNWRDVMDDRSGVDCKDPIPEWFIKKHRDLLCFDAFERLMKNHGDKFTDDFIREFGMFLCLRPTLDMLQHPGLKRFKELFYMGPIQDITLEMLDENPEFYERGAWDGFLNYYDGYLPPEFVARHLNRIDLFYVAINSCIPNGVDLLKMFSLSAGDTRVCTDGSRVTGQRRYKGRRYLRSVARFDTCSQASSDTNRTFAEKCDKYFPAAMMTRPTEADIALTLKSAMTAAKRAKIDMSAWPHFEHKAPTQPKQEPIVLSKEFTDALNTKFEDNKVSDADIDELIVCVNKILINTPSNSREFECYSKLSDILAEAKGIKKDDTITEVLARKSLIQEALPVLTGSTFQGEVK